MNSLIFLAQAFFDHQTRLQTDNLKVAGMRAAEMGRRMALAGVFFALAGAFIFSGFLIALIDLGLQIDRGQSLNFSGLMISATILFVLGAFAIFGGWLCGRDPKAVAAPPPPPPSLAGELRPLLEAVAVSLLKEFLESRKPAGSSGEASSAPSSNANEKTDADF